MKTKIKKLFQFIGRAWSGGGYGKLGVILTLFACFTFTGLFWGDVSIQRFGMDILELHNVQSQLTTEQETLNELNRHIKLLQNGSPDYIEELGLKYLNIGTPDTKILKI
ncbi:MAG: hypothetical protein E7011_01775 [Alphaproteobacteria bacterium]|nr:hypothetical protein [Alphaproteobacteria bacterium]